MTEPTTPSRRAAERDRDNAVLNALLKPDVELLALATAHFKGRDPFNALIRWFTATRAKKLRRLIAINDLRTELTLSRARQPAAAALLRLTSDDNPETARKASADLLKSAPKRAQPRKPALTRPSQPPRSDNDQNDLDAILDRMTPASSPPPVHLPGAGEVAEFSRSEEARTKLTSSPTDRNHHPHRAPRGGTQ